MKVIFTTPIHDSLRNTDAGYLVAVAGFVASLHRDTTKVIEMNVAILAVYRTRLLAPTLVNIGSPDAHPDLLEVGESGQLLWQTLRAARVGRVRLYEVVPLRYRVRLMRLTVNGRSDARGRTPFRREWRPVCNISWKSIKCCACTSEHWLIVVGICSICPLGNLPRSC